MKTKRSCPFCLALVPTNSDSCDNCHKALYGHDSTLAKGCLKASPRDWAVWVRDADVGKYPLRVEPGWIATIWRKEQFLLSLSQDSLYRLRRGFWWWKISENACLVRTAHVPMDFPIRSWKTKDDLNVDGHICVALRIKDASIFVYTHTMTGDRKTLSLEEIWVKHRDMIKGILSKAILSFTLDELRMPNPDLLTRMDEELKESIERYSHDFGLCVDRILRHHFHNSEGDKRNPNKEIQREREQQKEDQKLADYQKHTAARAHFISNFRESERGISAKSDINCDREEAVAKKLLEALDA